MCQAEAAFPQAHNLARKAGTLLFKAAQQLAGPKPKARLVAASSSETPEILFTFTCSQQLSLPTLPEPWHLSPAHSALDSGLASQILLPLPGSSPALTTAWLTQGLS